MSEDSKFAKPALKSNLTGREIRGVVVEGVPSERTLKLHSEAVQEFPERARVVRKLLDSFQFLYVRDVYRERNVKSATPLKPQREVGSASLLQPVPQVRTNEIKRENVIFTIEPRYIQGNGGQVMSYTDVPNVVSVNLSVPALDLLVDLEQKADTLSDEEIEASKYQLFSFYESLFHELGHAYGYLYNASHTTRTGAFFSASRSGPAWRGQQVFPNGVLNFGREAQELLPWMEGFNDLQAFFGMRDYLKNGHSLGLGSTQLSEQDLWHFWDRSLFYSWYGPMTVAIDCLIEYVADTSDLPYPVVFSACAKAFQTSGGNNELRTFLSGLLGSSLTDEVMQGNTTGFEVGVLAHKIAAHLNDMSGDNQFSQQVDFILDMLTHP